MTHGLYNTWLWSLLLSYLNYAPVHYLVVVPAATNHVSNRPISIYRSPR
jgi:hypothetical protein